MKKIITVVFFITIIALMCISQKNIELPKEIIRYRIISNDNSEYGQLIKWDINKEIVPILANIERNSTNINEARQNIEANIPKIENVLKKYDIKSKLIFGYNYFPKKEYNNIQLNAGNYESLVITLGNGLGDNWWCILFPPLCLLEATYDSDTDIKYDYYFKKIINKYI